MIAALTCGEGSERVGLTRQPYTESTEFQAVYRAQRGDTPATQFLLSKYRNLVWNKARSYFLVGAESEDLVQVGMIGLWQAIVDYKAERSVSFSAFAKVCISNHMMSAIQAATRCKQNPLNSSLSLEATSGPESTASNLSDVLTSPDHVNPETTLLSREDTLSLRTQLVELLSEFEWRVLASYRIGKSYREIASDLGCKTKSVDNALTRIKHKVSSLPIGLADLSMVL